MMITTMEERGSGTTGDLELLEWNEFRVKV